MLVLSYMLSHWLHGILAGGKRLFFPCWEEFNKEILIKKKVHPWPGCGWVVYGVVVLSGCVCKASTHTAVAELDFLVMGV